MTTLVAGLGNVLRSDDGFGIEVARLMGPTPGVHIVDFGVRVFELARELLTPCDRVVLVGAMDRGERPGTLFVLEPCMTSAPKPEIAAPEAPTIDPLATRQFAEQVGACLERVWIVGCQPATLAEQEGLSEPVARSVGRAVRMVLELCHDAAKSHRAYTLAMPA